MGGKGGKGKGGKSFLSGEKGKDGKGKAGKGKDKKGKGDKGKSKGGKGKGKEGKGGEIKAKANKSSLLDTLSSNLLGRIIKAVLNLLSGEVSDLNPLRSALETKSDILPLPLPNPLTDPLGVATNPMISSIIQAI